MASVQGYADYRRRQDRVIERARQCRNLEKNTEFLNSYHPVDLDHTLLYSARRSDRSVTEQFFAPGHTHTRERHEWDL